MKYLIVMILILLLYYYYLYCNKKTHSLTTYKSTSTEPLRPKQKYQDDIDYIMFPLSQATRIENTSVPDKRKLYNNYNEAVRRYSKVYPRVRKHPQVPNIETVVTQRDRAYLELLTAHINQPPEPPAVAIKTVPKKDKLKIEVKSSAQNVHDHNVNDELSKRYKAIKINMLDPISDNDRKEMKEFIDNADTTKKMLINLACKDKLSRFDDSTEEEIWLTVWKRIHSNDNKENKDSLLLALKGAIEDCKEDGHLVCTTGRVTRALDSLTLLDKNSNISTPIKTDDIERKETYDAAHKILQRELDKKGAEYKKSYENDDLEDTNKFDAHVKDCIRSELKGSKYTEDAVAAI